ncbi:hypothetical protein [uncultured Phycicoccus sp.]|nr:hypothetical protein [uncultured Phycicoccus sp.]
MSEQHATDNRPAQELVWRPGFGWVERPIEPQDSAERTSSATRAA